MTILYILLSIILWFSVGMLIAHSKQGQRFIQVMLLMIQEKAKEQYAGQFDWEKDGRLVTWILACTWPYFLWQMWFVK
jgi:hypothetical protein